MGVFFATFDTMISHFFSEGFIEVTRVNPLI